MASALSLVDLMDIALRIEMSAAFAKRMRNRILIHGVPCVQRSSNFLDEFTG